MVGTSSSMARTKPAQAPWSTPCTTAKRPNHWKYSGGNARCMPLQPPARESRIGSAVMQVTSGRVIVAHSETGHHHAIDDGAVRYFSEPGSPTLTYLAIDGQFADVVHHRPYDTHETLRLTKGLWEVRRQREWSPEGWRVVSD